MIFQVSPGTETVREQVLCQPELGSGSLFNSKSRCEIPKQVRNDTSNLKN